MRPSLQKKFTTILFADDTTFVASDVDYNFLVNTVTDELDAIKKWTEVNRLSLNNDKTNAMCFSNRMKVNEGDSSIVFNEQFIKYEKVVKFLGVHVDDRCKFDFHIDLICRKISKVAGILYRLRSCVPEFVLIRIYYSLVYPYLIYCNTVWGGTSLTHTKRLLLLQKRIVRNITKSEFLDHTDPLFRKTGILKISDIHRYLLSIYVFKNKDHFLSHENIHNYATRNKSKLCPLFQRLDLSQRCVEFSGSLIWNSLPSNIVNLKSLSSFKKEIKSYFVS